MRAKNGRGWAWAVQNSRGDWCLCHWVHPTRTQLKHEIKPSPEARAVFVEIVHKNPKGEA